MKQYYIDNPEARAKMSEIKKQYHIDNPEERAKMSEIKKQYHIDNPEAGEEHGERMKQYYIDNPEAREEMSEIGKEVWKRPGYKKKMLDAKGMCYSKPFDVYTKDGTFIKTFTYVFEAREYLQREYNITSVIKITEVLNEESRKSSAGFVFKYQE